MKIFSIAVLLSLAVAVGAFAEDDSPQRMANQFLDTVSKGKVEDAYGEILKDSPIAKKKEDVEELIKQTQAGLVLYGKTVGYECFKPEKFGSAIVRIVAIQKFEQHPWAWEFYFYKTPSQWVLSNIKFSDRYETILRNTPR